MRRRMRWLLTTGVSVALVAAYLILPGVWQWGRAQAMQDAKLPHRIDTAVQPVDPRLVAELEDTAGTAFGPVIITYHDVGLNPSPYTVTPQDFETQMQMLHAAGWTTLSVDQLDQWEHGALIPKKSLMISFDDGATGVWQYADPILARYGFRATAFIITGFVGTHYPYYMTWPQIKELEASGRWDLESHTHLGHVRVPVNAQGDTEAFMTAPQWLPAENRSETEAEFEARVYADLAESKRQFDLNGLSEPTMFAYPFSAHEGDAVQRMVLSLFQVAALDDSDSTRMTMPGDLEDGMLRRMDIKAGVTAADFVTKIEEAATAWR